MADNVKKGSVDVEKCIIDPLTPWQQTTPGGIVTCSGNAKYYVTGGWRADKPLWDSSKCKQCLLCYPVCPDVSIVCKDQKMTGIDYDHCKGCLVCVNVCPFGALTKEEGGEQ